MGLATLGGIPFRIDPMAINWSYGIKTSVTETVGGKVVQVYGTSIDDMTVRGKFSSWQEQAQFLRRVEGWIDSVIQNRDAPPLRFTYAPRGWNFLVYVASFNQPGGDNSVSLDNATFAPDWSLTLSIIEDNGGLQAIRDQAMEMYIVRLSTGIGWKLTEYNGPMGDAEIESLLQSRGVTSVPELIARGDAPSVTGGTT